MKEIIIIINNNNWEAAILAVKVMEQWHSQLFKRKALLGSHGNSKYAEKLTIDTATTSDDDDDDTDKCAPDFYHLKRMTVWKHFRQSKLSLEDIQDCYEFYRRYGKGFRTGKVRTHMLKFLGTCTLPKAAYLIRTGPVGI